MPKLKFLPKKMDRKSSPKKRRSQNVAQNGAVPKEVPKPTPPADRPVHRSQDSLFSSSSGYTNYGGFLNLALLLLVLSNIRVALENIIKYGILINPLEWVQVYLSEPKQSPNILLLFISNLFILAALGIEKILASGRLSTRVGVFLYVLLLSSLLALPVSLVLYLRPHPIPTSTTLAIYLSIFLKLVSYAHVNYWCRTATKKTDKSNTDDSKIVVYPSNLTFRDLYYFMLAPTLCYELNFPRSPGRRKWFLMRRVCEFLGLGVCILALSQQWVVPLLKNSIEPFTEMDLGRMLERLLKLAIPNHIIWLLFFYWIFHSALNLTAELLRFADREFYRDWWNAPTLSYFWQTWNIPVHRWALRHVFKPLARCGFSSGQCAVAVFLISALFHEYLISVPLHMCRWWAFGGMLAQVPLSHFTVHVLKGGKAGNLCVWMSLILGQPLCILMYLHDWYVIHYLQQ